MTIPEMRFELHQGTVLKDGSIEWQLYDRYETFVIALMEADARPGIWRVIETKCVWHNVGKDVEAHRRALGMSGK